ncbi:MAG: hypothetical protein BWY37_02147 [Firmicutes bacterium ADurb.Bin262]|nr:MAG: hypothetical protein BWY37_02147 [Firmicutes bacterium ADurb.Bin262]
MGGMRLEHRVEVDAADAEFLQAAEMRYDAVEIAPEIV